MIINDYVRMQKKRVTDLVTDPGEVDLDSNTTFEKKDVSGLDPRKKILGQNSTL